MRYKILFFIFFICAFHGLSLLGQTPTGYQLRKVIIDPGHGGKDPGALGVGHTSLTESDIALTVSLLVRDYILENYDEVEVIMSREKDNFIGLRERTKKSE